MLLGARVESVKSGVDLLLLLQQWQSSWVPVGVVEQIDSFIEARAQEFCEGDHLGGKSETAIFVWVDSSVSLVSV